LTLRVEERNAFYKGMLAARRGKALSDIPASLNYYAVGMWIAGYNDELQRIQQSEIEHLTIINML